MYIKRGKPTEKQLLAKEERRERQRKLFEVYQEIWWERPHKSEISGDWLGDNIKTYFFHHLLPKNAYPDLQYDKNNIILLTGAEHAKCEFNPDCYPEIVKRREQLLKARELVNKQTINK
jgi:hypothetical protein